MLELEKEKFIPAVESNIKDHLTCYYCHLRHDQVEAGGVWYCPNPLCTGPGGAYFRSKLKSYKEVEDNRHTVDPDEWLQTALAVLQEPGLDTILRDKIILSAAKFLKNKN